MESTEDVILSSVLQAEGKAMPPNVLKFLDIAGDSTNRDICAAISKASTGGVVGDLNIISAALPRGLSGRLAVLYTGPGLPMDLAELEAETLVANSEKQALAGRLAELATAASENPQEAPTILAELKGIAEPETATVDAQMQPLFQAALDRYEELYNNRGQTGVPTGFNDFDRITGGLKPGQVTVVAAETNGGKSTFALNVVNHVLNQGQPVLLFTLEMDRHEIVDLLVSMNAQVNRNGFNTGRFLAGEIEKMTAHSKRISRFNLFIDDRAMPTASQIAEKMRKLCRTAKLVVVDYVQQVSPADTKEGREQQVAGIARALRIAAKECKLPMLLLSQLNDEGKIRESRVVAHEAHNVIMLQTSGPEMRVKVVKGRSIPKMEFAVEYLPQFALLRDYRLSNSEPYADK